MSSKVDSKTGGSRASRSRENAESLSAYPLRLLEIHRVNGYSIRGQYVLAARVELGRSWSGHCGSARW